MSRRELDPRTLRWASRKAARYERELRGCMVKAPAKPERDIFERAALAAFVLGSTYLREAKAIERKRKPKT